MFEGEQGFIRGILRSMARQRRGEGLSAAQPFHLVAWADGRITLDDPATGERIELEAFGPTNAAVFATLLPTPASPPSIRSETMSTPPLHRTTGCSAAAPSRSWPTSISSRPPTSFHAHAVPDGIAIRPGDIVQVHGAPSHIDFGDHLTMQCPATVSRAGTIARAWTSFTALFELTQLYEVGFEPKETP